MSSSGRRIRDDAKSLNTSPATSGQKFEYILSIAMDAADSRVAGRSSFACHLAVATASRSGDKVVVTPASESKAVAW